MIRRPRVPIYRQLMDQIRESVARGRLKAGSRLPSVRVLSRELVVNPNTIARVYSELERDGILNTRPGLGVFVAEAQPELSVAARRQRLAEIIDAFLTNAVHLGFSSEEVLSAVSKRIRGFQFSDGSSGGP